MFLLGDPCPCMISHFFKSLVQMAESGSGRTATTKLDDHHGHDAALLPIDGTGRNSQWAAAEVL